MPDTINVLDHGYVRLVDHMGSDLTVVRRARHLPDAAWRQEPEFSSQPDDVKLINYLMKHKHTSPFEFVSFDFHVKLPIFVARQWMRHRTWKYNEISARYQELSEDIYVPAPEYVGVQSASNHQGRDLGLGNPDCLIPSIIDHACGCAFETYRTLIKSGCPRELARCVLPLSTYTEISAKVDLHNLFHWLNLRLDGHAQYEIRVYAEAILKLIEPIVPVCVAAWRAHKQAPAQPKDAITEKVRALIVRLDTAHVDRLYVTKDYTIGQLRDELKATIGEP